MKFIFILTILIFTSLTWADSHFIQQCERSITSQSKNEIQWLKDLFQTSHCKKIHQILSNLQSFSQFTPTPFKNKSWNSLLVPIELKDNPLLYHKTPKQELSFNLELFKEFTNLKHFRLISFDSDLCSILNQAPSIESISIPSYELTQEEILCIKNKNIKIYILGDFNPNYNTYQIKNNIYGIQNYIGDIQFLSSFPNLTYLGMHEYKGESSLKELMKNRNLSFLDLNLYKLKNIEDIAYLQSLINLSLVCYKPKENNTLENIRCKENRIESIKFLKALPFLKRLKISLNAIKDLTPLNELKHLEFLDLSFNEIENIPESLPWDNLRFLDISNNQIESIKNIRTLKNLEYLNLSNNRITDIVPLNYLKNLRYLSVGTNPIENIEKFVPSLKLKALNLEGKFHERKVEFIFHHLLQSKNYSDDADWLERAFFMPKLFTTTGRTYKKNIATFNFDLFSNIEYLAIGNNDFLEFPNMSKLKKLKYLDISNSTFSNINFHKKFPANLEYLNLSRANISDITPIRELKKLKILDLSNNPIGTVNNEIKSENLITLHLRGCGLSETPKLEYVPNLKELSLNKNNLTEFDSKNYLGLNVLELSHNILKEIPRMKEIKNLLIVDLNYNKIKDINSLPNKILTTHPLSIFLSHNRIENINELSYLPEFIDLILDGNPINKSTCPNELYNRSLLNLCLSE